MEHSFNIDIAKAYGIEEAIFINNLYFWIQKNAANKKFYYDGSYWTYNTKQAYAELFPYMTYDKVKRVIAGLITAGVIKKGNYNDTKMDRTLWYAFTTQGIKTLKDAGFKVDVLGYEETSNEKSQNALGQNQPMQQGEEQQCISDINNNKENNKEKTSIDIDVKNGAEAPAQSDDEKYFYTYLKEHCPFVYKMQVPLTYEQYKKACAKYSREKIWKTLGEMNNWKELNKKRRYAYNTLLTWLEKDKSIIR